MGFRFRKSYGNLFRINISKKGIGYSFGVKGARISQTARGTTRTILSAPGTGIAHITETKSNKKITPKQNRPTQPNQPTSNFVNKNDDQFIATEKHAFVQSVEKYFKRNKLIKVLLIISAVLSVFCISSFLQEPTESTQDIFKMLPLFYVGFISLPFLIVMKYIFKRKQVVVEYDIEDEKLLENHNLILNTIKTLSSSSVFLELETEEDIVALEKYTIGIKNIDNKADFLKSNVDILTLNLEGNRNIIFLPDIMLLREKNEFSGITKGNFKITLSTQKFVSKQNTLSDSEIISTHWLYENKDGSQDRRYKNNMLVYIYQFAKVTFINEESNFKINLLASNYANIHNYFIDNIKE